MLEYNFSDNFYGTMSIADNLREIRALDLEHPCSIDWNDLFKRKILFVENGKPTPFNDDMFDEQGHCFLSVQEWNEAFYLEGKLMTPFYEYQMWLTIYGPLEILQKKRDEAWNKFQRSRNELVRSNLRFEIEKLDEEIRSYF